jgi:hypothetical protein
MWLNVILTGRWRLWAKEYCEKGAHLPGMCMYVCIPHLPKISAQLPGMCMYVYHIYQKYRHIYQVYASTYTTSTKKCWHIYQVYASTYTRSTKKYRPIYQVGSRTYQKMLAHLPSRWRERICWGRWSTAWRRQFPLQKTDVRFFLLSRNSKVSWLFNKIVFVKQSEIKIYTSQRTLQNPRLRGQ